MYTPSKDLDAVQRILINDKEILSLLDLTGKPAADIAKRIIKRKQWDDLVGNDKRLCVYFAPARKIRNESFFQEVLQVDCHMPSSESHKAWRVQERVTKLLHDKEINGKYLYAEPPLGELPTISGFFCCGTRFRYYRTI